MTLNTSCSNLLQKEISKKKAKTIQQLININPLPKAPEIIEGIMMCDLGSIYTDKLKVCGL